VLALLGWRLSHDGSHAEVGSAFGGGTELLAALPAGTRVEASVLHFDVILSAPGNLTTFVKAWPLSVWGRRAKVRVDGSDITKGGIKGVSTRVNGNEVSISVPLAAGEHRVTWLWQYELDLAEVDDAKAVMVSGLQLLNISVTQARGAGFVRCESCPPGFSASLTTSSCMPCEAGTSTTLYRTIRAPEAVSFCTLCPKGRSSGAGSAECEMCGRGLSSSAGASTCVPKPFLRLREDKSSLQSWDVGALSAAWFGHNITTTSAMAETAQAFTVDGHQYYFSMFVLSREPLSSSEGRYLQSADPSRSFLWEELPPHGVSPSAGVAGVGFCDGNTRLIRSVAETLSEIMPVTGKSMTGIWARYSGMCNSGYGSRLRRTQIFFRCDPWAASNVEGASTLDLAATALSRGSQTGLKEMRFLGKHPQSAHSCEDFTLEWRTSAACPLCRLEDFIPVASSGCEWFGRGQRIAYVSQRLCSGGIARPQAYWEQACIGRTGYVVTSVIVPLLFVLCCLFLYVLSLRRRYAKYMRLEEQQGSAQPQATSIGAVTEA